MQKKSSKRFAFGLLLATAFACASCNEDTLLGRDVIPGSDFLNATFTDTLTLESTTVREDSLRTKNMARYVLGAMEDDVFGKTYAGIHTSLALLTPGVNFNDTAFVDSAVLSLTYAGHYGDTTKPFNVNVYRLTETLPDTSGIDIYGESAFAREETPIGQLHNFFARPNTGYTEGTATFKPQLRIPVDNAFAQALLDQDATGAFANQAAFTEYLKGFFIAPDTSVVNAFADGMMYVDLRSTTAESALTIYYHTPATAGKQISFPMDGAATNANYFKHNFDGTPVQNAIDNPAIDDVVFVQAMSGVKGKLNVPHLQSLGNVILNKAEIEVTQLSLFTDPETQYTPPA
ncbi:MAG TPA: DUF4270 family protein, partial [Chitinophagales bacterium]|nr:DUF4270 family protein [Chitinophagales bacterium]